MGRMTTGRPRRLVTAEEVLAGGRYRDCELWDGVPAVREPTGGWADRTAARIIARLSAWVDGRGLGWVFASSQGFLIARDPDRLLSPDTGFVARARLPTLPARGFVPMAPDLAIEVRSPTDTWGGTLAKARVWIGAGVPVVWAVDPDSRTIVVLRPVGNPAILRPGDEADAEPVLPGFRLPVATVFEGLPPGDLTGPAS
jgi:Uma2 family endonuclease